MITLNANNKRVTWRLDDAVHTKIVRISKASDLTLEEVANLILKNQDWEVLKPYVQSYIRVKHENELRKKRANEALADMDDDILNKIASMSPERLAELLAKG